MALATHIETPEDLEQALEALCQSAPSLKPLARVVGPLPLRRRSADFEGLAQIIISQQVSVASAKAIFGRLQQAVHPLTAQSLAQAPEETLRAAGLSRPKIQTLTALSEACLNGSLKIDHLAAAPAEEAHAALCTVKGIGPWTADIFLLFCVGHIDVFPSGDLALQIAVQEAQTLETRPNTKELHIIAQDWAPYRSVAARLFWAWYGYQRSNRDAVPV